jgi:DNA topoisomerase I
VASQMAPARYDATNLRFDVAGEKFKASGRVLVFDGFLKVYTDSGEEKDKGGDDEKTQELPPLTVGELVPKVGEILEEKKTKPPGRFTLGSLVKELERFGIGRPSTYAAITRNITDRGYVKEEKGKVVPQPSGETLIDYLRQQHPWVIDYALTGRMESFLDRVVENQESWQRFCKGVHQKMGYVVPPVRSPGGGPSEAQLRYANDLAARRKVTVPPECLKSGPLLSAWIAAALAAGKGGPDS